MSRRIAALVLVGITFSVGGAYAQESNQGPGPGFVEVTYMPAGAAFFQSKNNSPSFGNYGFGTAVAFNLNRIIGIEGELSSMIATSSDLQFGDLPATSRHQTCSATLATWSYQFRPADLSFRTASAELVVSRCSSAPSWG